MICCCLWRCWTHCTT